MTLLRLVSDYRWPIIVGGHLTMSVVACGVLVYVATRPDAPRPIAGYYEAARRWDVDAAVAEASRDLGWQVRFVLPDDVPLVPGMPRPVDVAVVDRAGRPVVGLTGRLVAVRPSDGRLTRQGDLVALPHDDGRYRTLVVLDEPGAWELRLDTRQQGLRFVHVARIRLDGAPASAAERRP